MRFTREAQLVDDSLNRYADVRKYEQLEQRLQAEKYSQQLQLVEREKQVQTRLFYAAMAILTLTLALGYARFRRLQGS